MIKSTTVRLLIVFTVLALLKACPSKADSLATQAVYLGFKAPTLVYTTIDDIAKLYGLNPKIMLSVAIIESGLRPNAMNHNVNGTYDIGLFQINTATAKEDCPEFNILNLRGNAMCAAKLMSKHKATKDPYWIGRYHSAKPDRKLNYYRKVMGL